MTETTAQTLNTETVHLVKGVYSRRIVCGITGSVRITERLNEATCPQCRYDGDPIDETRTNQVTRAHAEAFDTEQRIRQTVAATANSAGWTSLTLLRALLADIDRDELDAKLRAMSRSQRANLVPGAAQAFLTDADRAAAITIGLDRCHMLAITG